MKLRALCSLLLLTVASVQAVDLDAVRPPPADAATTPTTPQEVADVNPTRTPPTTLLPPTPAVSIANSVQRLPYPFAAASWAFASFDPTMPAGMEQMDLSYSLDGVTWSTVPHVYAAPAGNGVRDCSIIRLGGLYYVAYTAGNFGDTGPLVGPHGYFSIAVSQDLNTWTWLCNVDTTYTAGFHGYTWAPEWFVDRDGSVYVTVSLSTAGGLFGIFYTKATSLYLTSWTPVQRVGGDMASRSAIDSQIVRDADNYYLLYRIYTANGGNFVEMAKGTSPTSFALYQTGNWLGIGPAEGPNLLHLGGSRWRLYFYSVPNGPPQYSDSFDGMATWSAPAPSGLPNHGTALRLNDPSP